MMFSRVLVEFLEAYLIGVLAETTPTDVEAVLADQTMVIAAHPAISRSGAVFTGMRVPDVVVSHI